MTMRSLLVIDDEPIRYEAMLPLALASNTMLIICCEMPQVRWYLDHRVQYNIQGVLLDHDLGLQATNGNIIAKELLWEHPDLPVAIVSNNAFGAVNIETALAGVDNVTKSPASNDKDWAPTLLSWFERMTHKPILP